MPAQRDFTATAFHAAVKRQGFRLFAGAWLQDTSVEIGVCYRMMFTRDGKPRRRESLARAIKLRNIDHERGN